MFGIYASPKVRKFNQIKAPQNTILIIFFNSIYKTLLLFLSGNKRRITIKRPILQIEGITTKDGLHYYVTNESLIRKPVINVPQQIHRIDLSPVLNGYIHK
jgi:hypothetical protein